MIQRNLKKHPSPRPISLLAATALVVANMIGVGIFTSTGFMALGVPGGVPILIGWALGGRSRALRCRGVR